jgi:hypothetical protein
MHMLVTKMRIGTIFFTMLTNFIYHRPYVLILGAKFLEIVYCKIIEKLLDVISWAH